MRTYKEDCENCGMPIFMNELGVSERHRCGPKEKKPKLKICKHCFARFVQKKAAPSESCPDCRGPKRNFTVDVTVRFRTTIKVKAPGREAAKERAEEQLQDVCSVDDAEYLSYDWHVDDAKVEGIYDPTPKRSKLRLKKGGKR